MKGIVDLRGKLPVHKTKRYAQRLLSAIRSLAIHNSLTLSGSPLAFANYHVFTNNWAAIGYTYVIGQDGTVYQCLDWTQVGAHVGNSNKHALGICLVGDFRTQKPTAAQYQAAINLVWYLQSQIPSAKEVKGHSEYPGYSWKACPVISMSKFRADVAAPATIAPQYPAARVLVNEKPVANGLLIDNRAFAPLRSAGEAAGAVVGWNNVTKTASINGKPVYGQLIDGVTYVALRAVADVLGGTAAWDGETKTASIFVA
ncbi:N-acetylmuramoyl-L-alanine amidase [Paenibacillus daejeonensis]|uniref:N-acetylmuramoyl-L-alanine amidase n=1 Tax=Paenibacillus daejeonensis TaxID=135193 RepID=UPI00037AB1FE|nr:N-acetylmuramoyl-L-alanine amidase [Paenibacillus daejeonensis]